MIRCSRAIALASILTASTALAEGTDAATARELFRRAQEELKSEQVDSACAKFAEAQRLDPNVGYLVNLARCDEKRGRLADARDSWQKALDLAKSRNDSRAADVEAGLRALDPKVPRIVVQIAGGASPPSDLRIQRDDTTLGPASLGVPLPVNPGRHVIGASAPGRKKWSMEIVVHEGDAAIHVDIAELPRDEAASTEQPQGGPVPASAGDTGGSPGSTQRVLGIVSGGVGIAAGAAGTYFALHAKSLFDESNRNGHCDAASNACDSDGLKLRNRAVAPADIATGCFIAAGVLVVAGVVLYVTAPSSKSRVSMATDGVLHF
jgi:hypothetical protein